MRRLAPSVLVLVLLLAGCRADLRASIDVESSGTGTIGFEVGLDDELESLMESSGQGVDDLVGELPEGATALEPREEGDLTVYGFSRPFTSPEELNGMVSDGIDGIEAEASGFDLSVDDEGAAITATFEVPDASAELGEMAGLVGSLSDFVSASIRVHLPGEVVEHNADEVLEDGSLVWQLPLTGGTVDIEARSEAGGSGFPVVPVVAGVAVVAAGGAALYLLGKRRKDGDAAISSTPEPAPPAPVFDAPAAAAPTQAEPPGTAEPVEPDGPPTDETPTPPAETDSSTDA